MTIYATIYSSSKCLPSTSHKQVLFPSLGFRGAQSPCPGKEAVMFKASVADKIQTHSRSLVDKSGEKDKVEQEDGGR